MITQVKRAKDLHPRAEGPVSQAVVWSAIGDDRDTKLSVYLLKSKGANVTVKTLDNSPSLQAEFAATFVSTTTVALPQIVIDGTKIGGFKQLSTSSAYAATPMTVSTATRNVIRASIAAPKKN